MFDDVKFCVCNLDLDVLGDFEFYVYKGVNFMM